MYSLGKLSQHKVTYCQKSKLIVEKYFWVTINMHDETCKALVSTSLLTTLRNSLWNISLNPSWVSHWHHLEQTWAFHQRMKTHVLNEPSVWFCATMFISDLLNHLYVRYVASVHVCSRITYNQKLCCSSASFFSMGWSEMQEDTKDLRTIS